MTDPKILLTLVDDLSAALVEAKKLMDSGNALCMAEKEKTIRLSWKVEMIAKELISDAKKARALAKSIMAHKAKVKDKRASMLLELSLRGVKHREIAKMYGVSLSRVQQLLARARMQADD